MIKKIKRGIYILKNEIKEKVGSLLINFGITPTLQGFYYILDAVDIFEKNKNGMEIYEELSEKNGKSLRNIEHCIRYAFSKMDCEKAKKYFGEIDKLNNMQLISILAWKEKGNEVLSTTTHLKVRGL